MRIRSLTCLVSLCLCNAAFAEHREYTCKVPQIAASCYRTHGELLWAEGTPAVRMWKIGTKRVLGIYSSLAQYRSEQAGHSEDSESPELPANVHLGGPDEFIDIYGEFEVCPLKPSVPGHMQPVCIESAAHLVYKRD